MDSSLELARLWVNWDCLEEAPVCEIFNSHLWGSFSGIPVNEQGQWGVFHSLYHTVVTKSELSWKAKLSIYRSIFACTLTYGHESWVIMTQKTRSWVKASKIGFLRRVAWRASPLEIGWGVICDDLGVEQLILCVERSQLNWFGNLVRMPLGHLPREVFQARPAGRKCQD